MTDRYLGSTSNEIRQKYTYTQAENFRLTALQSGTCASGYTNLQNISYSYDDQGNVLTVVDTAAFGGSQTQTFTYDALNRLLTAQAAGGSHGTYAQRSYVYNNAGNIDSFEGVTQHYLDGAHKHAVTHVGGTTEAHRKYWYDQNGNATRRINGSQDITLAYDAENHVTSITGSGINASYVYDGDGNRVKATFGTTTTVYVGNYYERDNGTTVRKYYYTGGVRVAMRSGGQTSYLLSDHLGGTNVTANGTNGAELGRVLYRPWGETRLSSGSTPTTWRFTGQREDATIGLYYFNARYLDPQLGRFTQPDTIVPEPGNPQALNRYAYSFNNPLRFVDPNGHDPLDATWVAAFRAAHDGRDPTDADRLYRLYSLTYAGPISGSYSWSAADWQAANLNWNDVLQSTAGRESVEDFASAIGRLAEYYYDFETTEFVSGIALLFAGVAYNPGNFVAFVGQGFGVGGNGRFLAYANHGMGGVWRTILLCSSR